MAKSTLPLLGAAIAFILGAVWQNKQGKADCNARVYQMRCDDLDDFYRDSSYLFQEGHKLDLPEEISKISWYDDTTGVDLMAAFINDAGDIHFEFTGRKIKQDSLLSKK